MLARTVTRASQQLNPVFGHRRHFRSGDDLRIHAHLDRFEHVAPRQIDGGCLLEVERDTGLVGRDEGIHHPAHIAAGEKVALEVVGSELDAAQCALIIGSTIAVGLMRRKRMPKGRRRTPTPEKSAVIQARSERTGRRRTG
jgi:hypothetical protein